MYTVAALMSHRGSMFLARFQKPAEDHTPGCYIPVAACNAHENALSVGASTRLRFAPAHAATGCAASGCLPHCCLWPAAVPACCSKQHRDGLHQAGLHQTFLGCKGAATSCCGSWGSCDLRVQPRSSGQHGLLKSRSIEQRSCHSMGFRCHADQGGQSSGRCVCSHGWRGAGWCHSQSQQHIWLLRACSI